MVVILLKIIRKLAEPRISTILTILTLEIFYIQLDFLSSKYSVMMQRGCQITMIDIECVQLGNDVKTFEMKIKKFVYHTYKPNIGYKYRILENAVRLDDIDRCWYTEDENIALSLNINLHRMYNNIALDFSSIFSDPENLDVQKRDDLNIDPLFVKAIVQIVSKYASQLFITDVRSWEIFENLNFYQKIAMLGYTIFVNDNETFCQSFDYEKLNVMAGLSIETFLSNIHELAINFATNFQFLNTIIKTCDIHFQRSPRTRMPYTKMFPK